MQTKTLLIQSIVLAVAVFATGATNLVGQDVLDVAQAKPKLKKIELEGIVTAVKKYSFQFKTEDKTYGAQLNPGTDVTLRLNRPAFNFSNRIITVLAKGAKATDEKSRVRIPIPERLFVTQQFDHERQMNRSLNGKSIRLNDYRLTAGQLPPVFPTKENLTLQTEITWDAQGAPFTILKDKKYPLIFGFRNATIGGQTISQFHPNATKVYVWGEIEEGNADALIRPTRIEFEPVVPVSTK